MTDEFLQHIKDRKKIKVTYFDNNYTEYTRLCTPLNYGPSNDSSSKGDMFHLLDEESEDGNNMLFLKPGQIITMVFTHQEFHPSAFQVANAIN